MESIHIKIAAFINPHCFFITEADSKHRTTFLHDVSARIKKSHVGLQKESFLIDEMVAVYYKSDLVRATILEKSVEESKKNNYFCWLVDYAILIETEQIFKLPKEIQKITPRAKQACLNNFCYLKEQLELGVTGKIRTVPSIFPSSGVIQYCLDILLTDYFKLVFEVVERYNNILIGEILIYKKDQVIYLTKELCNKGLIATDEIIFQRIKYTIKDYVKMNLESKSHRVSSPVFDTKTAMSPIKKEFLELEELDLENLQVLENGRRRKGIQNIGSSPPQTSGSEDDRSQKRGLNKVERLLQRLKKSPKTISEKENSSESGTETTTNLGERVISGANCSILANKTADKNDEEPNKIVKSVESLKSEVATLSRTRLKNLLTQKKALEDDNKSRKKQSCSSSTRSDEGLDNTSCESSLEDNKIEQKPDNAVTSNEVTTPASVVSTSETESKSPFGAITSQRKTKPLGLFLPAGMEGRYSKERVLEGSKKGLKRGQSKINKSLEPMNIPSSTPDDDCPTIKIPKCSGNLTDDQISAEERKEEKKGKDEGSSSDPVPPEIFTKQDFCRLIAGCTCVKCRVVLEDDDWDTPLKFAPAEGEKKKKRESNTDPIVKPPKLLRKEVENENFVQENDILAIDYNGMSPMEKKMSCKVLVHGESIPNPIRRVAQVNIHRDIYNNINRLNYKEAKRIQHYAFPAITRNQHVFMINDTGSGKTMAYLPILSSFVMEKDERYSQLFKMGGGPIVVILCSNSKKCEEIYDLIKLIFGRERSRVNLVTYPGHGNISNVDILITMPTILNSLISSRATNFKRLCHFVLEDGDVILKSRSELVKKFLDYGDQVLGHRHCPKSIQIILCAEHWTPQIENLLKKLNKVPLVCIGNHLEAALYGKISFTMKFLETGCKEQNLQRILHDVYKFTKSIIICNPDEIEDIINFLPLKGIEFVAVTDEEQEDIAYKEVSWSNAVPGKYPVLICTDDIYNTMTITNAQLLIHYSLPRSWTQFIRRFSCLLENHPTPLNIKQRKENVSTFVFIDENCEPRMSKFVNFIKIAGLEKDLPEKVKGFLMGFAMEEELKRVHRKLELCEAVRIFGKCDSLHCKKRHLLDKELDYSDNLPQNGSIQFKILKMTSATTCSIKLLEHFDLKGQSVEKFEDYTEAISEILAQNDNYQYVSKPIENHLYLHKDGDTYCRCKLVELNEIALVYLIDRGIYCKSDLNKLFRMSEDLKKISQQCYEVHLANLIPPHEDTRFSRSAKHKAQLIVDINCPNSMMTARIVLQLGNHLWLEDVYEVREMYDKSLPSIGFQLSRQLVKQELAVKSETALSILYTLSKDAGIALPEYNAEKPHIKKAVVEQVNPQWAFLDVDAANRVQFSCGISPGEFYVKLQTYNKELAQLELDVAKEIRKPFYPSPQKIEPGKCYLVKDEPTGTYSRGLVLKLTDDGDAHVFCVDYGDEISVPVSTLKYISNDFILRLPFQSIQCSMYGIKPIDDDWTREATDLLYKMGFEDDSDIFRTLYVKTCSRQANELIPRQNSYSVIVKDGFSERHLLLNELLIDCGFGIPSGEAIRDFELPEENEEEEDIEEISRSDEDVEMKVEYDRPENSFFDADAFDFEIFDAAGLMEQMNWPVPNVGEKKVIEPKKSDYDDLPPMKAMPSVDYSTPQVYWSQTNDSVKLTIKITDVRELNISLKHNRIFQFSTEIDGKKYQLKLMLYDKAEKTFQYTMLGPEVRVRLTKCQAEEWPRLLYGNEKMKNIHYDVSTIKDEEKPRKLLDLGLSDSSGEDDEDDGLRYHVCSDLESEYDYDIPNDND